ncbi:MAG: heavy metal translocating P-type ATPase [Gammaproteobacteria bacterium]
MITSSAKKICYHCGLEVPVSSDYTITIFDEDRSMCCPGCLAVARAIVDNNLTQFYSHRTSNSNTVVEDNTDIIAQLELYDNAILQDAFVKHEGVFNEASLMLEGIVCAACVWLNEKHVNALNGVKEFRINYSTHRAYVIWDDNIIKLSDILKEILNIGYRAHPFDASQQQKIIEKEHSQALWRIAIAGLGAVQVMMFAIAMYAADSAAEGVANFNMDESLRSMMRWVSLLFASPVVFFSAQPFFKSAYRDIKRFRLGMDVPVAIAILSAFSASIWATLTHQGEVYYDSVTMFTLFLLSGRFLEMRARHKAGYITEQLIRLLPTLVTRVNGNDHEIISRAELKSGDQVLVKTGETIPADGIIINGTSLIDESIITGESQPLEKKIDDAIIGGSINTANPIILSITKTGADTVIAGINRLLQRAQSEKPQIAKLADKAASWFVTVLILITTAVGIWWYLHDANRVFEIVLSVLVVTCPCALSLATPAAMTAITGKLTRFGILTTRSSAVETLAKVTHVVFDKTGTLTYGKPKLVNSELLSDMQEDEVFRIAASIAKYSEHPLSKELYSKYKRYTNDVSCESIQNFAGRGISGVVSGTEYILGNAIFMQQHFNINRIEKNTELKSLVYLSNSHKILARFDYEDIIRDDAIATIKELKRLSIKTVLLSGDDDAVTKNVAKQFQFDSVHGNCRPQDKLNLIQVLQDNKAVVAMIGDGINDAPVLAGAQVSMAMGSATQLAQASADMVLLSNRLIQIPQAIKMSKQTMVIIKQNIAWAIIYNLLALPLAAMGIIAPWMAALGMSASSLLVVTNALRLTLGSNWHANRLNFKEQKLSSKLSKS